MQEEDINPEEVKTTLKKIPHVTVYEGLIQAASDLYSGAIFVDWEWINDSEEVTFALKGVPYAEHATGKNRDRKMDEPVDVLYHWAITTENMDLYQLGIFRKGNIIDAGVNELSAIPDTPALLEFIARQKKFKMA